MGSCGSTGLQASLRLDRFMSDKQKRPRKSPRLEIGFTQPQRMEVSRQSRASDERVQNRWLVKKTFKTNFLYGGWQ